MENDEVITEQIILAKKINDLCTDIVERSCRVRPTKLNLVNSSACILHDLVIAKLNGYGLGRSLPKYINSYLEHIKQCLY